MRGVTPEYVAPRAQSGFIPQWRTLQAPSTQQQQQQHASVADGGANAPPAATISTRRRNFLKENKCVMHTGVSSSIKGASLLPIMK